MADRQRRDGPASSVTMALLCVAAVAGQAAALALIDVEPYAVYQHYRPWPEIVGGSAFPATIVGAQILLVVAVGWRARHRLAGARRLLTGRVALVLLGLGGALTVPSVSIGRTAGDLAIAGTIAMVSSANLLLIAIAAPVSVVDRLFAWCDARLTLAPGNERLRRWDRALPWAVALWVVILAGVAAVVVTERVPHIDDSVSYYFQAKYHAAGHLALPPPPDPDAFHVDEVIIDGDKWYGYGSPGWPVVLALGVAAGVPWLVNPLLGGGLVIVGHALLRRRSDRATANATVLLLASSPWLVFMSAEFMPHPLTALLAMTAVLAFDRAADRNRGWLGAVVLAGAATGAIALTRPVEAVFVVVALGATMWIDGRFQRALPAGVASGLVALALGALILPFNQALTGRATYTPQMAWTDRRWGPGVDRLGFGPGIGIPAWRNIDPLPGHGPADVLLNVNKNAFMANVELLGWTAGSLLLCAMAVGLGQWRRSDGLLLSTIAVFVVGYSGYWFSGGPDLGPRYWYPLIVPLAALSARGAQMVTQRLADVEPLDRPGTRIGVAVAVACLTALGTTLPWRAATKHYRYRDIGGGVRTLADARGFARGGLVFVRGEARSDYQNAFNLNPPTLNDASTIYAYDAGTSARARVVARFPDRQVWVIARDPQGRRGAFQVVAGPLTAGTVPP